MAIYYMNVQIISRNTGRSATGAAAYRAGERIHDDRTGLTCDYTRRRGDIETEILAPQGAPAWVFDRAELWNHVEKAERRGDAQLCREIVVALPMEMGRDEQRDLIRSYVGDQFVARGMAADVAIHRNPGNPHAHVMLTMREVGPDGLSAKKNRDWNKPELLEQWRAQWAVHANRAMERAGREERIDHRSLAEQGSDRVPQIHLGPQSATLERRGISTQKGEHNRLVAEHNAVVLDLDKAREEKRRLTAQKAVADRCTARIQRGWTVERAKALAELERASCGPLGPKEVAHALQGHREEVRRVQTQTHSLTQEGRRLERAGEVLKQRRQAAEELERLGQPSARLTRWFSPSARKEWSQAQERLLELDQVARGMGIVTDEELCQQRARWKDESKVLSGLGQRFMDLSKVIGLMSMALEGYSQEREPESDWMIRRQRSRSRELDRSR